MDKLKLISFNKNIMTIGMFRCQDQSLQSIRKDLLRALNMQKEPQLPAGAIESVREQWQRTFSNIAQSARKTAGKWNL